MSRPFAADHINEVRNDLLRSEKRAIHPPSPLLHQSHHIGWRVGESFSVGHVCKLEPAIHLNVDLQTHNPVLSQVFIRFCAGWRLRARHILEEGVEGSALDRLPPENTVGTWQHLRESKPRLAGLVGCVAHLVLEELRGLHEIGRHAALLATLSIAGARILI